MSTPAAVVDVEAQKHAQLQEEKKGTIGGTDAAVIALETAGKKPAFGRSMFDIWLRLTGRAGPQEDTDRFEMGRLMEEPVARRFTRRTGLATREIEQVVAPGYPWKTGHIDRAIVVGSDQRPADLECKTVEWDPLGEWSDPNMHEEQRVPLDYFLQITWYVGIPRDGIAAFERLMYAAAQFGLSSPLRIYKWVPDDEIQRIHARMHESAQRFWEENVLKDDPPATLPVDPEAAKRWLKFKHPSVRENDVIPAINGAAFAEVCKAYAEARDKATYHDEEKKRLGAEIGLLVGDHYGVEAYGPEGSLYRATWPVIPGSSDVVTDWESLVRDLDVEVPAELIAKHSRMVEKRAAYRRLAVNTDAKPSRNRRK